MARKKKSPFSATNYKDRTDRHIEGGPLHDLLLKACPPDETGKRSISVLAASFNPPITPWAVHKWVLKGKIPPGRVVQIVDMSPETVTLADFSPFVYV